MISGGKGKLNAVLPSYETADESTCLTTVLRKRVQESNKLLTTL
jgi:hypothetical protein